MGRLGDSEGRGEEAELRPREVSAVSHASVAEMSVGPFHAAVSTEGGDLYTWGANFFGQLGHEESSAHSRSETEEFKTKFKEVGGVVVDAMDLVVRSRVTIDAEGAARSSAGDARAVRALALVKAYTGHKVSHVSCGGAHTVAVCTAARVPSLPATRPVRSIRRGRARLSRLPRATSRRQGAGQQATLRHRRKQRAWHARLGV